MWSDRDNKVDCGVEACTVWFTAPTCLQGWLFKYVHLHSTEHSVLWFTPFLKTGRIGGMGAESMNCNEWVEEEKEKAVVYFKCKKTLIHCVLIYNIISSALVPSCQQHDMGNIQIQTLQVIFFFICRIQAKIILNLKSFCICSCGV